MNKGNKSGKKAMGIAMTAIMIAFVFAMVAPASVAAKDVPPGEVAIYWLVPKDSSALGYCENATVEVWLNSTIKVYAGEFTVNTNPACGDIVIGSYVGNYTVFDWLHVILKEDGTTLHVRYGTAFVERPPGVYHIGNFKMHCNSTEDCKTDLNFIPDIPNTFITNFAGDQDTVEESGTFTCEKPKQCLGYCYESDDCSGDPKIPFPVPCKDCFPPSSWKNLPCPFCPWECPEMCWVECPECCDGSDNDGDGLVDCDGGPLGWSNRDTECLCCVDSDEKTDKPEPCIPEAATIVLVGIGLLCLVGIGIQRRRRGRKI